MSTIKIQRAYCVELDEIVSIDTARREYFSLLPNRLIRFNFLCSDQLCRFHNENGVRVTGVNYNKLCEEKNDGGRPVQSAHYRSNDRHHPDCEWSLGSINENLLEQQKNETNDDFYQRKLRYKLNHFIDEFSPENDTEEASKSNDKDHQAKESKGSVREHNNNALNKTTTPSKTVTSVLSRLVETWSEAKSILIKEEFNRLILNVKGIGRIPLYQYFKQIQYFVHQRHVGVIYGGAELINRYGKGFKFRFYDKVNEKLAYLYCDKKIMESYRYHRYIESILSLDCHYFKVYFLDPKITQKDGYVTYELKSLKNIHIVAINIADKNK